MKSIGACKHYEREWIYWAKIWCRQGHTISYSDVWGKQLLRRWIINWPVRSRKDRGGALRWNVNVGRKWEVIEESCHSERTGKQPHGVWEPGRGPVDAQLSPGSGSRLGSLAHSILTGASTRCEKVSRLIEWDWMRLLRVRGHSKALPQPQVQADLFIGFRVDR